MKDLCIMAQELRECKTLTCKEDYLLKQGRVQHIESESGLSWALSKEEPERFINIGSNFYYRKPSDSDRKYNNICITNGKYLYELFPLIFEFYDEFMNGNSYEEGKKLVKKKINS